MMMTMMMMMMMLIKCKHRPDSPRRWEAELKRGVAGASGWRIFTVIIGSYHSNELVMI